MVELHNRTVPSTDALAMRAPFGNPEGGGDLNGFAIAGEDRRFRWAEARIEGDTVVVGVSKDSIESHCKFADKYKLKFALLSDPDGKMLEKYGAWGEKNMYGKKSMGIIRSTVLIGPDGKVIKHFPKVKVKGHVDAVIEALSEARSD